MGWEGGLDKGGAFANFQRGEVKVVLNESRIILYRHSSICIVKLVNKHVL